MQAVACRKADGVENHALGKADDLEELAHLMFGDEFLSARQRSQARFLINCGLPALLQGADVRTLAGAQKLITEHGRGEGDTVACTHRRTT